MPKHESRQSRLGTAFSGTLPPPAQLGFRMPGEWERHEATWIAWPHNRDDWPGKIAPIRWVYAEIVRHLAEVEKVHILVQDGKTRARALAILRQVSADLSQVRFHVIRTNRSWVRDYGPMFVVNEQGKKGYVNWKFNAWAKYPNWHKDNAVNPTVLSGRRLRVWNPSFGGNHVVLEGGSIDVNGQGLLLTTEECQLSDVQGRNPGLSRADLEKIFADYLGIRKTLWLGKGITGDDTHGHVDDLARFVGPRRVVTVVESNAADPNYGPLQDNLHRLREMTDEAGRPLEVVELPMPHPLFFNGQRLPASYANFYIANGKVLVPTFNDANDRIALGILAEQFPDRVVVGIHAVDLVWGFGTLHCLTQQEPAGH